ncbi:MAG: endonuclease [Curvibacter sp. RIFCSPHIGHO2_12_FULL_63_18]|jgi:putative phage-type endonuclease|uniref:YqaJ viral recombinase family nuclease n=1 Tax=Rhodoferax sp. TaxID=50421 RepID=UPI0008BFEFCA|nr:YqaJ viral recombinase family protein [Rhodoferax sp.]OGO96813.1 MAG: endonuclease [Curvibacter sp. GWA2_63_95]OGP00992.1 MAG: endonuclease [Curvibacter sp. RIFCSPHIGHO2_12_FULL_63_18]HCX80566.1 endonuclease [Rhodoferax sp.]
MSKALALDREARPRPALKLVKTNDLSREDWLSVRRNGIGSSDAAAAVGLNPYKSQLALWMEKTGRDDLFAPIDVNDESTPVYWGTLLEPIVAASYVKRTGNRVRKVNAVLQHPDHPFLLANLDREIIGVPEVQILECKTAGVQGARLWKDGVPEYVVLQVQHQLAVTGKRAADVAVLIGGQELQIHRIKRDDLLIERLIQLEEVFWGYVQSDVAPPVDGSDSADQALRRLYPNDVGSTVDFSQDLEMSAAFSDLVAVRQTLDTQTKLEALLKQRIQQRMGEASKAVFETGDVTWRRCKDGVEIDLTKILTDHPDYQETYAIPRPGSRRFLVNVAKD